MEKAEESEITGALLSDTVLPESAPYIVPESLEVIQRYTGKIIEMDEETASLQIWDAGEQKPYVLTYEASALAVHCLGAGDRVMCTLQNRQGKIEMVFAPYVPQLPSAEERKRMREGAEAKYAAFPGDGVY